VAPAQVVAGVLGAALVVIGLIGLAVNSSFATGAKLTSDSFLGFEVNGWDDLILGVALGLVLLVAARRRSSARGACRIVAVAYLVVFIAGLGGDDAFGWVPANTPDDVLRLVLALVLLGAAHASKESRDAVAQSRVVLHEEAAGSRVVGPGSGHVGGPRTSQPRIDRRLPVKKHP
jgi:uncharacterized membrane protein YccC